MRRNMKYHIVQVILYINVTPKKGQTLSSIKKYRLISTNVIFTDAPFSQCIRHLISTLINMFKISTALWHLNPPQRKGTQNYYPNLIYAHSITFYLFIYLNLH